MPNIENSHTKEKMRAGFEAWARKEGLIEESHGVMSISSRLEFYWKVWQAATQRQQERIEELEEQVAKLTTALFECREAFPIPEPGAPLEPAWMGAMTDPEDVPEYVKAQVQALSLDAGRWRHSVSLNVDGSMKWLGVYDAWDGDGSFTDQIDKAIARATHKEQT